MSIAGEGAKGELPDGIFPRVQCTCFGGRTWDRRGLRELHLINSVRLATNSKGGGVLYEMRTRTRGRRAIDGTSKSRILFVIQGTSARLVRVENRSNDWGNKAQGLLSSCQCPRRRAPSACSRSPEPAISSAPESLRFRSKRPAPRSPSSISCAPAFQPSPLTGAPCGSLSTAYMPCPKIPLRSGMRWPSSPRWRAGKARRFAESLQAGRTERDKPRRIQEERFPE